jgi:hypothetical protein
MCWLRAEYALSGLNLGAPYPSQSARTPWLVILSSPPPSVRYYSGEADALSPGKDLISQAELRKGAEFMIRTSSAARLVRELYLDALERRIARGAVIESGPLAFVQSIGIVPERKEAGRETQVAVARPLNRSS